VAAALFDEQWTSAAAWRAPATGAAAGGLAAAAQVLAEQERALLELLVNGETDERVARKLGVSIRTVGRMTSELMRRLGAQSRFQAGALAVSSGWIPGVQPHG
jgi:DNA-binding NarL/FixJ family response regulator